MDTAPLIQRWKGVGEGYHPTRTSEGLYYAFISESPISSSQSGQVQVAASGKISHYRVALLKIHFPTLNPRSTLTKQKYTQSMFKIGQKQMIKVDGICKSLKSLVEFEINEKCVQLFGS